MVQTATSSSETSINVLIPRLKNYVYTVEDGTGKTFSAEVYEVVNEYNQPNHQPIHWKVQKVYVKGLQPNVNYSLKVLEKSGSKTNLIDQREFKALDLAKNTVTFAFGSCMADDARFENVIDPMWNKIHQSNPDILILNGDLVYVDGFEFVERKKATALDIWQRYVDALRRLPIYRAHKLIPVLAAWDDHDFGTNDGDRNFVSKDAATTVFKAFFRGKTIPGVWEESVNGNYSKFIGFNQAIYMTDGRTYRQNKNEKPAELYGHWGEEQHSWLINNLKSDNKPSWIFGGDQFLNAKPLGFKETFQGDHPLNFDKFVSDLKDVKKPFVFGSGDIHFSEIMLADDNMFGFKTFEFTSSSIHSFVMGKPWDNPLRIVETNEYNFMLIKSTSIDDTLILNVKTIGLDAAPYFIFDTVIKK